MRSVAREREFAVRLALGARRSRLVRQLLTETLVLATLGGMVGLLIAPWAAGLLVASRPNLGIDTSVDMRVIIFGLAAWALTGVLVGQAPILASSRIGLAQVFANHARTGRGAPSRVTVHDFVVTFQIALSLVILIGAGLFVQSLRGLSAIDPGFRADRLLVMAVDPGSAGYDEHRRDSFWRDALDRVARIPGVESVSLGKIAPMGSGRERRPVFNEPSGKPIEIDTNAIGPRYFATMAIPLLRGREFSERDGKTAPPVAIVNERMARMFWPNQDPLSKGIPVGPPGSPVAEIVGIVKDVKHRNLRHDGEPMIYFAALQSRSSDPLMLHVRTAADPSALAATIRRQLQTLDARLPVFGDEDARGAVERVVRADAPGGGPDWWLRHSCAVAERNCGLRGHGACGQPADTRDRHPHGAWSASA